MIILILAAFTYPIKASSTDLFKQEVMAIDLQGSSYQLSGYPIMNYSETVYADSVRLIKGRDYTIDYRSGLLTLNERVVAGNLFVDYLLIPENVLVPLYQYQPFDVTDSTRVVTRRAPWQFLPEDGRLMISGIKTFALTLSDEQTLDIKQSLFLNLSGELSPEVNIEARLSDSQSQLSPEGDTRELSSLDDVYFKIFGRRYEIALGNLEWGIKDTRFINYHSKFEGINLWYDHHHAAQFAYSANNGKQASIRLFIIDGKQGPYYLRATEFQQNFIIIAGSERIYLDGVLLERGSDYSIDYAEGSVMFRRLVSSTNRINVRFQYSDERYKQSMFINSSELRFGDRLRLRHNMILQRDDRQSPLQYDFSPADLDSLRQTGDNAVWGQGVFDVGTEMGIYKKMFTTEGFEFYEYAPDDTASVYLIHFSFVGLGNGDYVEFSSGKYRFIGIGQGSWLPQKRLIPPVLRSNSGIRLTYETEVWETGLEALYSVNDKNTYSILDDDDNQNVLLYGYGTWKPEFDRIRPVLSIDLESRTAQPYLFADVTGVDTDFDLYQLPSADSLAYYQIQTGARLYTWFDWTPELMWRHRNARNHFDANSIRFVSRSKQWRYLPSLDLRNTFSAQKFEDGRRSELHFHRVNGLWVYKALALRMDYLYDSILYTSSDQRHGTRLVMYNPSFGIGDARRWQTKLGFQHDQRDGMLGHWERNRESERWTINQLISTPAHQLNLDASRKIIRNYLDSDQSDLEETNTNETSFNLANLRSYHHFLRQALTIFCNYNLNQTEFFPRIRELEYVGAGLGLYDSTGVYVQNGDYDYIYITAETGILSTEINAHANIYFKPSNLSPSPLWRRIHTDIMISATEQNNDREDWKVMFLYPGTAFNDSTTIYGKQNYQQTLWLDLITGKLNAMFQFSVSRSLDRRYQSLSRTSSTERLMELVLRQVRGYNFRLRVENSFETDTRFNSQIDNYNLSLQIQRNINPLTQIQLDIEGGMETGKNTISDDEFDLFSIGVRPSVRSTFMQKYRISSSLSLSYNQRSGASFLNFLPEKRQGVIGSWNLSALYRLNSYTSASIEYTGNSFPNDETQHQLKIEFKAEI